MLNCHHSINFIAIYSQLKFNLTFTVYRRWGEETYLGTFLYGHRLQKIEQPNICVVIYLYSIKVLYLATLFITHGDNRSKE